MRHVLFYLIVTCLYGVSTGGYAQIKNPPKEKYFEQSTGIWVGAYTKYRVGEKLFYYGEYHVRTRDWADDMAQIYLRFGMSYLVSKYFEVTAGFVNPYYWAPNQNDPNVDKVVPQFRGWQQLIFFTPFDRLKLYHQIRTEQRFKRDYRKGSEFELTHRFRYKITAYYPLNNPVLEIGTYFLSFYEEIFIQAGKPIIYDHMEDNRLFLGLGYILNENIQLQTGYMYTFRHAGAPNHFEHRHILRFSLYHNLDFHKE